MANSMIEKMDLKRESLQEDRDLYSQKLMEEDSAIEACEEELVKRQDLVDRLRSQIAQRAQSKNEKERELFGTVDKLKKTVVHKNP